MAFAILIGGGFVANEMFKPSTEQLRKVNNEKALSHCKKIMKALERWRSSDYDANGKENDYPLGPLKVLYETKLINGRKIELINWPLAMSDLRNEEPIAKDGYFFTLTSRWEKWPTTESAQEVALLAIPEQMGESGSCILYFCTSDKQYYVTNYDLMEGVADWDNPKTFAEHIPPWPTYREIGKKIWSAHPRNR